jgi:undecaprenyl-diphosphatase
VTILEAIVLGVVEGVTEFLPISSTGHHILASALLGLDDSAERKHAVDAFNIVIQGGAVLAVLGLYWPRVVKMLRGVSGRDELGRRLLVNLFIAFVPAALLGPLMGDFIEEQLFRPVPVMAALALGGAAMLVVSRWQRTHFVPEDDHEHPRAHHYTDIEHLTWRAALVIGLLQCVAMWPGTSRSMMTIVAGMLVGLRPRHAAEFSFLLGLPTLGGACLYKGYKTFGQNPQMLQSLGGPVVLAVGFLAAAISAAIAIEWLVSFLNRHGLALFGWYRIALCAVLGLLVWRGWIVFS